MCSAVGSEGFLAVPERYKVQYIYGPQTVIIPEEYGKG